MVWKWKCTYLFVTPILSVWSRSPLACCIFCCTSSSRSGSGLWAAGARRIYGISGSVEVTDAPSDPLVEDLFGVEGVFDDDCDAFTDLLEELEVGPKRNPFWKPNAVEEDEDFAGVLRCFSKEFKATGLLLRDFELLFKEDVLAESWFCGAWVEWL